MQSNWGRERGGKKQHTQKKKHNRSLNLPTTVSLSLSQSLSSPPPLPPLLLQNLKVLSNLPPLDCTETLKPFALLQPYKPTQNI